VIEGVPVPVRISANQPRGAPATLHPLHLVIHEAVVLVEVIEPHQRPRVELLGHALDLLEEVHGQSPTYRARSSSSSFALMRKDEAFWWMRIVNSSCNL